MLKLGPRKNFIFALVIAFNAILPVVGLQSYVIAAGTVRPVGADAATYHYNEETGIWENDYYVWNADAHAAYPKEPPACNYNVSTKLWEAEIWQYNSAASAYQQNLVTSNNPSISSACPPAPDPGAACRAFAASARRSCGWSR